MFDYRLHYAILAAEQRRRDAERQAVPERRAHGQRVHVQRTAPRTRQMG